MSAFRNGPKELRGHHQRIDPNGGGKPEVGKFDAKQKREISGLVGPA
jgi:hypothetical protein